VRQVYIMQHSFNSQSLLIYPGKMILLMNALLHISRYKLVHCLSLWMPLLWVTFSASFQHMGT
jgi:hypothetical protein